MINMISMSLTTELQSHTDIETLSEYHMLAAGKEWRTKKANGLEEYQVDKIIDS